MALNLVAKEVSREVSISPAELWDKFVLTVSPQVDILLNVEQYPGISNLGCIECAIIKIGKCS